MKTKRQRIDEGLQMSRAFMLEHGIPYLSCNVIALFCGCSGENIRQIEHRALRKLRRYNIFVDEDLNWLCHIVSRHYRREF